MSFPYFSQSVLTTIAALTLSVQMHAENVVLHEGDNQLPVYTAVTATFTPANDSKVVIASGGQFETVEYDGHNYPVTYLPTQSPSNIYEIDNVKAGSTITLTTGFVLNPLVRITTYQTGKIIPVELQSTSPAAGSSNFWANNGILDLSFNKLVTLTDAKLSVGSQQYSIEIIHVSSSISINVGTVLNRLLTEGTLKPGQAFMVTLSGVRDAKDPSNLYNGNGTLNLRFPAPQPQYGLISATVADQTLNTYGLNSYSFLSYYAPDSEDGLFTLEFGADVKSVGQALIQMGSRDLDAQGKYHESSLPVSIEGNKVYIDARGVLRSLNILFPAVVEEETDPDENVGIGMGEYDHEHLTLRVSNVKDINDNFFTATQAGNIGSYSFFMNYRELMETINFDGDNKMAGETVVPGEVIKLWLANEHVTFSGLQVSYIAQLEDETYEQRNVLVSDFVTEPDPYEGIIIAFMMPAMPEVAAGQTVRVALSNASSPDGMPHDLSIEFKAGEIASAIESVTAPAVSHAIYSLMGQRAIAPVTGYPCIIDGRIMLNR